MDPLELRRQRSAKLKQMEVLATKFVTENRNPSEDEQRSYDALKAEAASLLQQAERLEELRALSAGLENPPTNLPRQETPEIKVGEDRAASKPWESFGHQLQAIVRASDPHTDQRNWDPRLQYRAPSGLSAAVPSDGGFLVDKQALPGLLKRVHETGLLLSRVRTIPIGENADGLKIKAVDESSRANGSRWGGIQVYRRNEADEATASKPKFRDMNIDLEDMVGLCYATDNLLRDATALESVIMQGFGEEFGFKIDDEFLTGTGSGQCLGLKNAPALVTVAKETGQAADTVVFENIKKMWGRLWSRSRQNAVWHINQDVEQQLYGMSMAVGTGGVPVYLPAGGISGQQFSTLFGRPIIPMEQCATLGDLGDVYLADWSQYLFIEKGGVETADSIHVRFLFSERTFRFVWRNNGQPVWNTALTPKNGTTTLSPFVTLAAR